MEVRWYDGGWRRKWSVYTYKDGRRQVPWDEEVNIDDIVHSNVKLTPGGVLTASCKRELEKIYS